MTSCLSLSHTSTTFSSLLIVCHADKYSKIYEIFALINHFFLSFFLFGSLWPDQNLIYFNQMIELRLCINFNLFRRKQAIFFVPCIKRAKMQQDMDACMHCCPSSLFIFYLPPTTPFLGIFFICLCQVLKLQELNVLELHYVSCWQTMIKTQSVGLGLLKVCLFVKLESSNYMIYWSKFARPD